MNMDSLIKLKKKKQQQQQFYEIIFFLSHSRGIHAKGKQLQLPVYYARHI